MSNADIIFQEEPVSLIIKDGKALFEKHFREIAHYSDIILEPDFDHYAAAEAADALRCYSARENGDLIGYCIFFIKRNPHYKSSKQALQDIVFVSPEKRGFGLRFIAWCDDQLREEGVQVVYHHIKAAHDFGAALEKQGYELIDKIYGKRLDR